MDESRRKWEQFLSGDYEAYTWIYNAYVKLLYRYGLRFLSNHEIVEDVIQEVFLKLYKNRKKLPVPENIKVYLLISMKNSLITYIQRENKYQPVSSESIPFSLAPSSEDEYIRNELDEKQQELIRGILDLLAPRQREIIYYKYIQELDYEEICKLMDLNYQSAQNLVHRSIRKIREAVKPEEYDLLFTYFLLVAGFEL